jgi:hypothetical protein
MRVFIPEQPARVDPERPIADEAARRSTPEAYGNAPMGAVTSALTGYRTMGLTGALVGIYRPQEKCSAFATAVAHLPAIAERGWDC